MKKISLETLSKTKYGWPLRQLNIPKAHVITKGAKQVVVAVIDIGFRMIPQVKPHLWKNPKPVKGDIHGWDFVDNDASLEYTGWREDLPYNMNHHLFMVGIIAACAPACKIMILRVGLDHKQSWHDAVNYAVGHGARILVLPHSYMNEGVNGVPLFYQGTDFAYPEDNPGEKKLYDNAWQAGCLIFRGTADNRGRRAVNPMSAVDSIVSVGSSNRKRRAADIACSADYAEVAAPGGERKSIDKTEHLWVLDCHGNFVPQTGGCEASGFAGGVAALVMSRFPKLSNESVRQILRNTANGKGWNPYLGHGILDAYKAVNLKPGDITQKIKIRPRSGRLAKKKGDFFLNIEVENGGVLDATKVLVVAYNGDPQRPARPFATRDKAAILLTKQIGHTMVSINGFEKATAEIELTENVGPEKIFIQAFAVDTPSDESIATAKVQLR